MLRISNVTKVYRRGRVRANDDISMTVAPGSIVGLLGHNGAGKTTLVNQIVGSARPTTGSIHFENVDLVRNPAQARRYCTLMSQIQAPLRGVTTRQAVEMMAQIRGASAASARSASEEFIERLDLGDWASTPGEKASGGVGRITAYGMAAVLGGPVVVLDEPTNDVDPVRRRLLWAHMRSLTEQGHAVLVVTHNLAEADANVDRVVLLDKGRVLTEGMPSQIRSQVAGELRLELWSTDPDRIKIEIRQAGPPFRQGRRLVIPISLNDADSALKWARELRGGRRIDNFAVAPMTLEDAYVQLTGE